MYAAAHIPPTAYSVNITKLLIQMKLLRTCPEVVKNLLKKIANDQAIAEMESKILCYIQLAHITAM